LKGKKKKKILLKELDLENDSKLMNYDFKQELHSGTKLHQFLVNIMCEEFIPKIVKKIQNLYIPAFEEMVDAGKIGEIFFGLEDIGISQVDIPLQSVGCSFEENTIIIVWNNIHVSLNKFKWNYRKETFPKLKDSGNAEASVNETIVCITMFFDTENRNPRLRVVSSAVKIGDLDIKISGSVVSVLYNVILGAFSKTIKIKIQEEMYKIVHNYFETSASDLLKNFINTQ